MKIGIDGNMWYVSNGMCLGDPRSEFSFERTLREAIDSYKTEHGTERECPVDLVKYLDMTPEEYHEFHESNGQFGVGA